MGVLTALGEILSPQYLLMMIAGTIGGIMIGAMPGLTSVMGVTLLLPFTYGMDPAAGISMLLAISFGAIYGGSITAILIGTPGTPASAATMIEGRQFTARGEGGRAIGLSTFASWIGGTISALVLICVAPQLAKLALKFGPPEYFCLAVFGLTIIASISGKNMLKGIIAGLIGLLLSTIGLDPLTGFSRYSFGVVNLYSGLQTVPLMIGLFAIAQVFMNFKTGVAQNHITQKVTRVLPAREDLKKSLPVSIMCGFIGTFIGIIPAAGADIAAFVSYDVAKKRSKHPEEFGTGCVEGIAAPEAGNNGDTSGALVPMLTLGVPGDATAAVLIGALTLQGLQPGPQLFTEHMDIVNRIFASTLVANFLFLVLGLLGVRLFIKVIQIKPYILTPHHLRAVHPRLLCPAEQYVRRGRYAADCRDRLFLPETGDPHCAHRAGADSGAAGREQSAPVPAAESGQRLHLLHPAHLHLLPAAGGAVPLLAAAAEGAEQPEKGGVRRGVWRTFSAMDL